MISQYRISKLKDRDLFLEKLGLQRKVRIFSAEWDSWWCKGFEGYTTKKENAGVFTLKEAWEHCYWAGPEKRIQFDFLQSTKTKIVLAFIAELKALGVNPIEHDDYCNLEYSYEKDLHKKVCGLIYDFIGFWKAGALEINHSREDQIARFKFPYKQITGEDLTPEQLMVIVNKISKKIFVAA